MKTDSYASIAGKFVGKKICVTGATGFKGAWLCECLIEIGAEVSGFSLPELPTQPSLFDQLGLSRRIHDVRGDVRDAEAVHRWIADARPDYVFHLAAQPLVRLSYSEPGSTWETNALGTIHVLEALRRMAESAGDSDEEDTPCVAIFITTDKVYRNKEWEYGYREVDELGGYDPYSSSKAGAELAIASWRQSFFRDGPVRIASARAGNVIGGGDWALDRIVPDAMRALASGEPIPVRNPQSTRPWQHVLEPLSGYLLLAAAMSQSNATPQKLDAGNHAPDSVRQSWAFNFGPNLDSNRCVQDLVEEILKHWPGRWENKGYQKSVHEAGKLNLATEKAYHMLGWRHRCGFEETIRKTVYWYKMVEEGANAAELTRNQIREYFSS